MTAPMGFGFDSPYAGIAALSAQTVNGLISAFASRSVTRYQNAALQAQANIARINAETMERRYQATLHDAESQITRQTMQAGQVKHSQRASLAANGIAVGVGSAAEQQASTDLIKEMDRNTLARNALSQAWGYRWQGVNYSNQALAAEASKQSASRAFWGSLLGSASQIGFNYMGMQAMGMFDGFGSSAPQSKPVLDAVSGAHFRG
ncbi:MAG: hypothetical protein IJ164_04370 [Duodenibacillus sp.]|nr:hypothetical protein [Duodenibacillus sp.]